MRGKIYQVKSYVFLLCRWDNATWDPEPFWRWALKEIAYAPGDIPGESKPVPPQAAPCGVWLAPKQKMLIVTHRHAASVALVEAIGTCYGPQRAPSEACLRPATGDDVKGYKDPEAFWADHT